MLKNNYKLIITILVIVCILLVLLVLYIINTTYQITINNVTYEQKILDYIIGRN